MPNSFQTAVVLLLAVLPGALYTWCFEREAGKWGVALSDRVLRFAGYSAIFQLIYLYPGYWVWTHSLRARATNSLLLEGHPLPYWFYLAPAIYVGLPMLVGTVGGFAVNRRNKSRLARRAARILAGRDPAPRAWDNLFSGSPSGLIRLRLQDGARIGGFFGARSYAAGYGEHPQDLYLERSYVVKDDGTFEFDDAGNLSELGAGVLIKWENISVLEFLPEEA